MTMAVYVVDQFASVAKSHVQGERLEGLNRRTILVRAESPAAALRQAIQDAREREAINKSLLADDEAFLSSIGLTGEYRSASSIQVHATEGMVLWGASGVSRVRAHIRRGWMK